MSVKGINIEIIALQEIWNIDQPQLLQIDGFNLVYKQRVGMRGGGVGFYIKNCISYEIVENCSPFENKILESITLLLTFSNKSKILVTSVYRSNGVLPNVTTNDQLLRFTVSFNDLMAKLSTKSHVSFMFTDSNINLINPNQLVYGNYLNTIFSHGYLQLCKKATRMIDGSATLIDHIITNCRRSNFCTGTLISDVSDHFISFICNGKNIVQGQQRTVSMRIFSATNILKFKEALANSTWLPTLSENRKFQVVLKKFIISSLKLFGNFTYHKKVPK